MLRTLVVAPNWVGDTVMALPVLEALARSDRWLAVLAPQNIARLLEPHPAVSKVLARTDEEGETVARIESTHCHEAIILPGSFRSAWIPWRAGIPYRWGYRGNWRTLLLSPPVPAPDRKRHQIHDYRELLEALDVAPPASWIPRYPVGEALRRQGGERIARTGVGDEGPLVGLFPGAEFGPSKRWPWRRFADLTTALRRSVPGIRQLLVVGPKEVWLGVRIHEESGKIHPVAGPDLDLAELAGLLSHLDLLVTNDSGPMHLAAAVGVPCVALFGPTDPGRTAPTGPGHLVLSTDPWCSPCFRKRCPLLHHRCLRDLGVDEVAGTVIDILAPRDDIDAASR